MSAKQGSGKRERVCIHCLKPKCACKFKAPKHYDFKLEISNQSTGCTVEEMKATIDSSCVGDDRRAAFRIIVYTGVQPCTARKPDSKAEGLWPSPASPRRKGVKQQSVIAQIAPVRIKISVGINVPTTGTPSAPSPASLHQQHPPSTITFRPPASMDCMNGVERLVNSVGLSVDVRVATTRRSRERWTRRGI